jgi:decaprenylphospho-beta-D-erythro-pentofuranosid-2-ulose 2-reductase
VSPSSPVLILGAHSDIGRALARAYAKQGRPLLLAVRAPERLEADATDLRLRHKADVKLVVFDVLDLAGHKAFLDGLQPFPGTIVSVIGFMGEQAASETDAQAARLVMDSNYMAPALLLGEAANRLAGTGGSIIGISSVAGDRGRATNYVYGSAKAGFTAFLSGLRNRFAKTNVRVITVKPGFVDTRMTEGMKLPPLLTAQPEEVANAILAAEAKGRDVIYVRPIWLLVMTVIRLIPERIFKKLKL